MLNSGSNPRLSNNFKDFARFGFDASFDHNMTQIVQNFIKDSVSLYEKMLNDENGNIVNDSDFNKLYDFANSSFSNWQKTFGIKSNSVIIPLEFSTSNIAIGDNPIIPGFDKIKHFFKFDDNISKPKKAKNVFSELLNKYNIDCENRCCGIPTEIDDQIIPVSYCIPMANKPVEKTGKSSTFETPSDMVGPQIINVYTNIDKDDFYRILTLKIFTQSIIARDELCPAFDYSNFRNFFRSMLSKMISYLNSKPAYDALIGVVRESNIYTNCKYSAIGSINKFYGNVSHGGVKTYIMNKIRWYLKNSKTSVNSYGQFNEMSKDRNSVGVISGTRDMDFLFNYVVGEVLNKKLFNSPKDQTYAVLEYSLSNSITFIITLASISIGGSGYASGVENIIMQDVDEHRESVKNGEFEYIDSMGSPYGIALTEMFSGIVSIIYGTFAVKYCYDFRTRMPKNKPLTFKAQEFLSNLLQFGTQLADNGYREIRRILQVNLPDDNRYLTCQSDEDRNGAKIEEIKNPNGVFDILDNIRCRITNIDTIYKLTRYFRPITFELNNIEGNIVNSFPVHGGQYVSKESADVTEQWSFGKLFARTSPNLIDMLVKGERIGDIKSYCDHLVADVRYTAESDGAFETIFKRSLALKDSLSTRQYSVEEENIISSTLRKIGDKIAPDGYSYQGPDDEDDNSYSDEGFGNINQGQLGSKIGFGMMGIFFGIPGIVVGMMVGAYVSREMHEVVDDFHDDIDIMKDKFHECKTDKDKRKIMVKCVKIFKQFNDVFEKRFLQPADAKYKKCKERGDDCKELKSKYEKISKIHNEINKKYNEFVKKYNTMVGSTESLPFSDAIISTEDTVEYHDDGENATVHHADGSKSNCHKDNVSKTMIDHYIKGVNDEHDKLSKESDFSEYDDLFEKKRIL